MVGFFSKLKVMTWCLGFPVAANALGKNVLLKYSSKG